MMAKAALTIGLSLVATGWGCSSSDKSSSTTSAPKALTAERPIFRTANTDLASAEGCYLGGDQTLCAMQLTIAELTNQLRQEHGLSPLRFHAGWSHVAQLWSHEQASATAISHDGFPNRRIAAYEDEFGNDGEPQLAAENVGEIMLAGKTADETAKVLVKGWYESPGHRKNILAADYKFLGVGIFKNAENVYFATQLFAWEPEQAR